MVASKALKILCREGLRPPKTLTIALTGACNLACGHCWVAAGEASSAAHVPERTVRRLIEEFLALDGERIRFTGGEPLCHPGWLKILQFGRSIGLRDVSLQTNGMLFTDDSIAALRELDFPHLSIQISLDGATAATHDLVRGAGAFDAVQAALQQLVRGGLAQMITLFFTEMSHNLEEIPALLELADGLGIGAVVTGSLVDCGRASTTATVAPPELNQYLRLLSRYDHDRRFRELYRKIGNVAALEWRATEYRAECCTFVENPYLTADGRLYPCVLCHTDEYAVTGIFGKNLAAAFAEGAPLWSALLRISHDRADALPECRDCPGKLACAGGCMGRAWGSCGDLRAADDRCELRQAVYRRDSLPDP
ncbi:MAG TPA: radical SAM protein [Geobacteraceae bacterium]|nr:radical SAM protein [Geobacteraceae bacterium]